jgi:ribonuclease J
LQVPQAVVVQNGDMLRLAPGRAQVIDEVPAGRVYMDGRVMTEADEGLTRHRRAMAFAGFIGITLALDGKGRLAGEPSCFFEGVPQSVQEPVRNAVAETVKRHNPKRAGEEDLKEQVRRAARRAGNDAWGKKPVTRVEILWV